MRVVQFTDCHLFAQKDKTGYSNINPYKSLSQCLQLASQFQPDLLLCTGDISGDHSAASYRHFLQRLREYVPTIETRVIAGNHDLTHHFDTIMCEHVLCAGTPARLGNWCIHGLDTRHKGAQGKVDEDELLRVEHAIKTRPDAYHLLALHHHPVASNSWMDTHNLINATSFLNWLSTQPISAVVHGHTHTACENTYQHHTILGAPSTCWQWAMTPEFGASSHSAGFRIIDLPDNGRWHSQIRRIS